MPPYILWTYDSKKNDMRKVKTFKTGKEVADYWRRNRGRFKHDAWVTDATERTVRQQILTEEKT